MTTVKTTGCRWKAAILEELAGKALAVHGPTDDVILEVDEAVCNPVNNPTDSWRRWSFNITKDMVQT